MKIFNLTDIETPLLKQHKLVEHTFAVGPKLLGPGETAVVDDQYAASVRAGIQVLVAVGALYVGAQPPPLYVIAKEKRRPPPPPPAPPEEKVELPPPPVKAEKKGK